MQVLVLKESPAGSGHYLDTGEKADSPSAGLIRAMTLEADTQERHAIRVVGSLRALSREEGAVLDTISVTVQDVPKGGTMTVAARISPEGSDGTTVAEARTAAEVEAAAAADTAPETETTAPATGRSGRAKSTGS